MSAVAFGRTACANAVCWLRGQAALFGSMLARSNAVGSLGIEGLGYRRRALYAAERHHRNDRSGHVFLQTEGVAYAEFACRFGPLAVNQDPSFVDLVNSVSREMI